MQNSPNPANSATPPDASPKNGRDAAILLFALFFPTILTYLYFIVGKQLNPAIAKYAFGIGKTIQFAFPVLIAAFVLRERWWIRRPNVRGLLSGALFGLVVGASIFFLGRYFANPASPFATLFENLRVELVERLKPFGLDAPGPFLVLFVFYSVFHSGLEEYYWRWFTFGRLTKRLPYFRASLVANAAFVLHHILLLGVYFGFEHYLTWICSFGVFVGGLFWQENYRRSDSIYGAWLSHGLIDAGIFGVGFLLLPSV